MISKNQFIIDYYLWRILECEKEAASQLSRLKKVGSRIPRLLTEFILQLPEEDRAGALKAKLKHCNFGAMHLLGEEISPAERLLAERMVRFAQDGILDRRHTDPLESRASFKKMLEKQLVQEITKTFGKPEKWHSRLYATRTVFKNGIVVLTLFDMSGRFNGIGYEHCVMMPDESIIVRGVSLCNWFGLAKTDWTGAREIGHEEIVPFIMENCLYFLQSAETMGEVKV